MAEEIETKGTEQNEDKGSEPKTYTEQELQELLQKEGDRRVTEALKKAERKNADKVREAEKLARMNETEKYEYELKQREAAIEQKERELALAENKNTASKILAEKGLSLNLVDFVVAEDADTMDANIKLLDTAFKACVKAEVEKRIGAKAPKQASIINEAMTKERFNQLNLFEQQNYLNDNPDFKNTLLN